jgi:hypothetical protein
MLIKVPPRSTFLFKQIQFIKDFQFVQPIYQQLAEIPNSDSLVRFTHLPLARGFPDLPPFRFRF